MNGSHLDIVDDPSKIVDDVSGIPGTPLTERTISTEPDRQELLQYPTVLGSSQTFVNSFVQSYQSLWNTFTFHWRLEKSDEVDSSTDSLWDVVYPIRRTTTQCQTELVYDLILSVYTPLSRGIELNLNTHCLSIGVGILRSPSP